jgi:hypothetical protein
MWGQNYYNSYFNKFPRMMTPKRLSPPKPATIAFSDAFALLQNQQVGVWKGNNNIAFCPKQVGVG